MWLTPPLPHLVSGVSPKPGAVPCHGIGAGCVFVELDGGERGQDFTGSRHHLPLRPYPPPAVGWIAQAQRRVRLETLLVGAVRGVSDASQGLGCFVMIFSGRQWVGG